MWLVQGMKDIPPQKMKVDEMSEKRKDLTRLLDNPRILQYVKERILPLIAEWKRNFYVLFKLSSMLGELGDFIKELHPRDKPSEKLKEYLKTRKLEEKMLELGNSVE
jgi:hypothetical protein